MALCVWLLETFSNQGIIKEFVIDCPIPDMKRFVAGLLKTAMRRVFKYEDKAIQNYCLAQDGDVLDYIKQTQGENIKHINVIDPRQASATPRPTSSDIHASSCEELSVVTLKHHNAQLPIIVVMMNSFIHLASSSLCQKSVLICGQFYMVFSHFAELGTSARHYLLKTKCLGRLLDVFFNGDPLRLQ